jgi:hypothetical protein
MITEMITNNSKFLIEFDRFNGSGWSNPIEKIINEKINPQKIERNEIEVSWDYSEIEFNIEKDNIKFILHLDDEGSKYLLLESSITESNKQKLREWATIIAEEVEKLKK